MEIFKNKFLFKLIASICVFLALFNFAISINSKVYAGWGGVLLTPIVDILTAIGDSVMELLHKSVQEQSAAIIRLDEETEVTSFWKKVAAIALGIVAGVIVIAAAAFTGGLSAAIGAWVIGGTFTFSFAAVGLPVIGFATVTAFYVGHKANSDWFRDKVVYLPMFSVTAEEIFSNRLVLFDVNFFDPMEDHVVEKTTSENKNVEFEAKTIINRTTNNTEEWTSLYNEVVKNTPNDTGARPNFDGGAATKEFYGAGISNYRAVNFIFETIRDSNGANKLNFNSEDFAIGYKDNGSNSNSASCHIVIQYSSTAQELYEIDFSYSGGADGYSASIKIEQNDFMAPVEVVSTETTIIHSTATQLQGIVSSWYFTLRNIAILVLMLVLIYVGIRIVISSTAGEKAKYKEKVMDWLVALCLLMIMHYIMAFSVKFTEKITQLVAAGVGTKGNAVMIPLTDKQYKKLANTSDDPSSNLNLDLGKIGAKLYEEGEEKGVVWPTDLAGAFRLQAQYENEGTGKYFAFSLCYLVLILYTLFFAFTYLRRVVYMAFLTMIAPLVALTYPIDKITDGKAQAFDAWLKEYIFNLLIQPLHLLLYTILVASAYTLASESPVYALVAMGFMLPAEKLLRRFFGFEKAKTPGLLGGAAGAALTMSGLKTIMGHKPPQPPKNDMGSGSGQNDKGKVKYAFKGQSSSDNLAAIAGGKPKKGNGDGNAAGNSTARVHQNGGGATNNSHTNQQPARSSAGNGNEYELQEEDYQSYGNPVGPSPRSSEDEYEPQEEDYQSYGNPVGPSPRSSEDEYEPQEEDYQSYGNPVRPSPEAQEDDDDFDEEAFLAGTTLASEDWDHGGFGNTTQQPSEANTTEPEEESEDEEAFEAVQTDNTQAASNSTSSTLGSTDQMRFGRTRALGARISGVSRKMAGRVLTGVHPLRLLGRAMSAAAFGTVGLLAGVASGDVNKAFQYTTLGIAGGNTFAKSLQKSQLLSDSERKELKESAEMARYGENYKNVVLERERKKMKKNEDNIRYLRQTMGVSRKEAKEILNTTGDACFQKGVTDIADIATIHKMTTGENPVSMKKALAACKYSKRLPSDPSQMSEEAVEQHKLRYTNEFKKAGYGKESEKYGSQAFDLAVSFRKKQSDLTKMPND